MNENMRTRGVVIAGAGLMGRWHAHAVASIGGRISAVVDVDAARADALARRHNARGTTDLSTALAAQPVAVHVCTPVESHVALASAALHAGSHVLIEKPFAPTAAAAQTILDRASESRLLACPVHQFLFQSGVQRAIAGLPSFGPLAHADFVACSAGADDTTERKTQLALDILPHPLSLLQRLLSGSLNALNWHTTHAAPGEVRITAARDGVTVGILISAAGRPTRNTVRLIGERGTMHVDLFHGFATFEPPAVSRGQKLIRPFRNGVATIGVATANLAARALRREPAYPGLRELIRAFYLAVQSGASPPITSRETRDVAVAAETLGRMISRA